MIDFSLYQYRFLLIKLMQINYLPICFDNYINQKVPDRFIILRNDEDNRPYKCLLFAKIQTDLAVKGTFYFRAVNKSNVRIINAVAELGHEIGYHYNDLVHCNGNYEQAISSFEKNLKLLRSICDVKTICMDGSPLSKWDNRDLWNKYNYRDFGIIGEPYLNINPNEVFYLTDTGRCWDGDRYSVRDKFKVENEEFIKLRFHTTHDIIKAIEEDRFPDKVMMTFHPQRWTNDPVQWTKELIWQGMKNEVKRWFFVKK